MQEPNPRCVKPSDPLIAEFESPLQAVHHEWIGGRHPGKRTAIFLVHDRGTPHRALRRWKEVQLRGESLEEQRQSH